MKFEKKYRLAPGSQVREEDFGLLFYSMDGPRLFFLSSSDLLTASFFQGTYTIDQWMVKHAGHRAIPGSGISNLAESLEQLQKRGVILEC